MEQDAILSGLNPAQVESVKSQAGVLQVLAPPGSGKTKTLTARVAYLIAERNLKPWNIVVCTFTRKAAAEMKQRISSSVGEELARKIKLGTFHAIAVLYLRAYGHHIGLSKDFGIADTSDSKAILKRILAELKNKDMQPGQALGRISSQKVKDYDRSGEKSDNRKQLRSVEERVEQQEFEQIMSKYEAQLAKSNLLDYDDILLRCSFLMRTFPQCVSNVEAVLIDEFQDTNNVQYDLMRLFAQKRNHITIVGDPDQSIYGFRFAEIENLRRMQIDWPDTLRIDLEANYRSTGGILTAAQTVIEQDTQRPDKKLQATHGRGLNPVLKSAPDAKFESRWIASEIKRFIGLTGGLLQASDFAILVRSAYLSRNVEAGLNHAGIPYRMVGGARFYDRAEIKLVLDYLRVIYNPRDNEAFERVINVPSRKIGPKKLQCLRDEANRAGKDSWDVIVRICRGNKVIKDAPSKAALESLVDIITKGQKVMEAENPSVEDLINFVIKEIDLRDYLEKTYGTEYEGRWANVEELLAQAKEASAPAALQQQEEEARLPQVDDLEQQEPDSEGVLSSFLSGIALTTSPEKTTDENGDPVAQVTICTIHSAKGLEWPVVFIPGCYAGSIPHSRSDDNDEERRLLYVGMTRAQVMLSLSSPKIDSKGEGSTELSSFLDDKKVKRLFEKRGPSIVYSTVQDIARTLGRTCPSKADVDDLASRLAEHEDADLDDAKPAVNRPVGVYPSRWDRAVRTTMQDAHTLSVSSTTMGSGFYSVKDKYNELVQQSRSMDHHSKQRKDKDGRQTGSTKDTSRAEVSEASTKSERAVGVKARERSLPECFKSFFTPRDVSMESASQARNDDFLGSWKRRRLTEDSSKTQNEVHAPQAPLLKRNESEPRLPPHTVRTAPLRSIPHVVRSQSDATTHKDYVWMTSSPERPDETDENIALGVSESGSYEKADGGQKKASPALQPAKVVTALKPSYHQTSMDTLQHQRVGGTGFRRGYGARPSMNGWANRGRGRGRP